jgi:hypothetical protein
MPDTAPPSTGWRRAISSGMPERTTNLGLDRSPLYWFHYYVLSLIPTLWLLSAPASAKYLAGLAATAVVMSSGMLLVRPGLFLQRQAR